MYITCSLQLVVRGRSNPCEDDFSVSVFSNNVLKINITHNVVTQHACTLASWVWVLMVGCCAEASTAAVLIGVVRLPGCPSVSALCLVHEVCRLGRLG